MSHSSRLPYSPINDLETGLMEVPVDRVNRWVQVKLYLKPLYRFRHTLVLKRAEEKKQAARKQLIRAHTQALRAAAIFKQLADQVKGPGDDFPIGPVTLARLTRNSDVDALQRYGGKEGLADLLKTNLDKGIDGGDLQKRTDKFGSNKNPPKTATSHWTCLWEALYDFTRIVLVIAFVGSVVMGIMDETKKVGWHDVFSVAIAAAMFIFTTVLSNYTQARLQHMIIREKMSDRKLKVIRAGRQDPVSICDIVVGDVILLEFDNEVPADGILIRGFSLAIDKSRVTGESMIFHEDSRKPFLQSGWTVAHGSATMLVTGVGKFTELGRLRASADSKDTEKRKNKTHLQVLLKEVATFMGAVGFMVAAIVAYVVWIRDFFTGDSSNGSREPGSTLEEVIRISIIAVAIFVVSLPEVLPLAFNISRLSSMKKMKADNVSVRRPAVCETMALCTDVVCDMTGITLDSVDDVQAGIKQLQRADIKVRLVRHDNPQTAEAIAMECGILASDGSDASGAIFKGEVFRQLSDSEKEELAEKILVMPRSTSDDELLLVRALQKRGRVVAVAVTGSVSNDARALQEADIGLAMGIQRIEVVKESSDIIILDGNFATVVKGFRWGRSMHEKVLRVMQQQLTANIVAVTINCLAAVYYRHIPLNAVQFVWVNVIIFGLGPLVLATESPADDLMNVPPIDRGQPLIKYIRWKRLLIQVLYQIIALLVINFQGGSLLKNYTRDHATKVKNTMIFNTFVICQISIEFGVRKAGILDHPLKWITANSVFLGIVGIILVIQFIIIEFLGKAFFVVRLD